MTAPTLPSLWTDILSFMNAFVQWDAIKGPMEVVIGLFLAGVAFRTLSKNL